jgi:hypothetical protein
MNKTFDCVEMKRKAQKEIYEETKDLSREEQIEYFRKAGKRFRSELESLRRKSSERKTSKKSPSKT